MNTYYDVIVIGAGPAGLTAALYTSRARLSTLIIERQVMGGELASRTLIENYPCAVGGVQGPELAKVMTDQALSFGAESTFAEVESISVDGDIKTVHTSDGDFTCKAIIVASGSKPRCLGVPGEEDYEGMGVFYCETCDGPLYAGKKVVVAGAGDSGLTGALVLANYCESVTVVEFMSEPKASKVLLERAAKDPKISIICGTAIKEIVGDGEEMTGVMVENRTTGEKSCIEAGGILVRIGQVPNTAFMKGTVELTNRAQIPVDEKLETVIPGIFAAGDVREYSPMQVSTAVGDGASAALGLGRYLNAH